ncbi:MAG TPA: ABC transporter ATP-binding protein [Candidatus Fermentibacter daniensis]|nr:ABC transporter ATP-binding protein [Candidatus Fermentibacter daniensis]
MRTTSHPRSVWNRNLCLFLGATIGKQVGLLLKLPFLLLLSKLFYIISPLSIALIIDLLGKGTTRSEFTTLWVLFAASTCVLLLTESLSSFYSGVLKAGLSKEAGLHILERVIRMKSTILAGRRSGDILSTLTGDVDTLLSFLTNRLFSMPFDFILAAVSSVILIRLDPLLFLIIVIIGVVNTTAGFVLSSRIRKASRGAQEARGGLLQFVSEVFAGMKSLRGVASPKKLTDEFALLSDSERGRFLSRNLLGYATMISNHGVSLVTDLVILVILTGRILEGQSSVGQLLALLVLGKTVLAPFTYFLLIGRDFQVSLGAWDRVGRTLGEEREPDGGRCLRSASGGVCFEDVWFSYGEKSDPVLRGIGFSVSDGEQVGLVGRSGAGKTTITDLILGFLDPGSGRVLVGGEDICGCDLEDLRKRVGVVPQAPFIFNRSIRDNITLGRSIAPEVLDRVLEESGVGELVSGLPSGLESVAGEGGSLLSGGERQRIAIARALVGEPRILILDEATSALDSVSEERVGRLLCGLKGRCTVIVIAHRLATVATLDRILLLDGGVIAAEGDHACLLETSAAYRDLFGKQITG